MAREFDEIRQQLIDVQSQLAFQEDTVAALNEALTLQQQEILLLQRQLKLLKERQDEQAAAQEPAADAGTVEDRPPHY